MDKENLQTKVEALQDNLKVKHDELTEIQERLNYFKILMILILV